MIRMEQCDDCNGAGENCTRCFELPDNCDCDGETFEDCATCDGRGEVEAEDEDDE